MADELHESRWLSPTARSAVESTIGRGLQWAADRHAHSEAFVALDAHGDRVVAWTYAELHRRADRAARALLGRFAPGDRVAIWAPSSPSWVIAELAAALAGLTLVAVHPRYGAGELRDILGSTDARGLLWDEQREQPDAASIAEHASAELPVFRHRLALTELDTLSVDGVGRLPNVVPADPAQIQYTAGTTGRPKAVLLTHGAIMAHARIGATVAHLSPRDRMINPMPMFQTAGSHATAMHCIVSGATHVLLPSFDPALVLDAVGSERGTTLIGFPTMFQAVLEQRRKQDHDVASLRYLLCGGASVTNALVRRLTEGFAANISVFYGMTECGGIISQTAMDDSLERIGKTVGRPSPETDLQIIDPDSGSVLPVGELGEICVRGALVTHPYLEARPDADADGWFRTGDFGSIDERGYCAVDGRRSDLVVRSDRFISPRPLEERIAEHPAVAEVVVASRPSSDGGRFTATVRPLPGATVTVPELSAWVANVKGPKPDRWTLVDRLPLTETGKVNREKVAR